MNAEEKEQQAVAMPKLSFTGAATNVPPPKVKTDEESEE